MEKRERRKFIANNEAQNTAKEKGNNTQKEREREGRRR